MRTGYLSSHKANVVAVLSESLLGQNNYYVMCEDGPFAGQMVYVNERGVRWKS